MKSVTYSLWSPWWETKVSIADAPARTHAGAGSLVVMSVGPVTEGHWFESPSQQCGKIG